MPGIMEALSPNPTAAQKARSKLPSSVLQSPTSPFFLGSNDDNLERAQARAARAAALRRKSLAAPTPVPRFSEVGLGKDQILDLFNNCIKLASENKINQKNTWELNLIDHLCDIIKVEEEEDVETNFQKASCTLEAGVKIYSLRVDSVHSEAYKVLGGINRAGHEDDQDNASLDTDAGGDKDERHSKRELEKMTPTSTLESSFEVLNVKKFDAAFSVDPLYHQTSAQFDEGGAKGLLLNNLGVYGSCKVLFDSSEIPGNCMSSVVGRNNEDFIDLSFAREYIEKMIFNMKTADEISPTLNAIVSQFDEVSRRQEAPPSDYQECPEPSRADEEDEETNCIGAEYSGNAYEYEAPNFEDEHGDTADQDPITADSFLPNHYEGDDDYQFQNAGVADRFENVETYLFMNLENGRKQNSWAGPEHWKYRKVKCSDDVLEGQEASPSLTKRSRNRKKIESDIDFCAASDNDVVDIFAPPKNPKSILRPVTKAPCSTKLPEDCHYKPEDLVKLFLLPNVMCLGRRRRRASAAENGEQSGDYGEMPSWNDDNEYDGPFDDGNLHSDVDESDMLVSQPRQVNKIEVQYDRTSKQVDVQALKEVLWDRMKAPDQVQSEGAEDAISFRDVLTNFPGECRAAATLEDISPHLCFICLLHLANEHGLRISGSDAMDDLSVHLS